MNVFLALLLVTPLRAEEPNLCTVSYLQNKIQISKDEFTADKMIEAEHGELYLDQRIVGFDESYDTEVVAALKAKGYETLDTLAGEIILRKFEVSLSGETFKQHLFIQYSLAHPLPGIKGKEHKSTIGMFEQLSQNRQAKDVVAFLENLPSCEELKKAAALETEQKKAVQTKKDNEKESAITTYKNSVNGYDGLDSLFESLKTERDQVNDQGATVYLGDWKPFTKAHKDDTTNESSFSPIAFDGEPSFHLKADHVEKNKVMVDIGCPGGYADLEFIDGEIKFSHWNCSTHWSYYHCKYNDKDDSLICNLRDENSNHSYVIYRRYDPFK